MAPTLQIVDPDNTSTVIFDLNDQSGANSALYGSVQTYLLHDPNWGSPRLEDSTVRPQDSDISYVTFSRKATAQATLRVRIKGTSYDNLNKALGVLAQHLSQGCVMKWTPDGSSETRFVENGPYASSSRIASGVKSCDHAGRCISSDIYLNLNGEVSVLRKLANTFNI